MIRLSRPQLEVFKSTTRRRVLVAGRRFGKTILSINELCKFAAFKPDKRPREIWYVAPYYGQAKEIAWSFLKEHLIEGNWISSEKQCNESALSVTIFNGNVIKLKGAANPDSLRGKGLSFVVLDEFQDMKQEAWSEVIRPSLSDMNGHALFIGTPKGYNWAFDMFQKGDKGGPSKEKGWRSWRFTTLEGGNVSRGEIEEAKRDLDERTFRQEYEASFETYAGIVYYAFDRIENVMPFNAPPKHEFSRLPLHIGMDFNISPMAATVSIETPDYTHAFDEIVIYSSDTREMSEEIRARYPHNPIYIYPDPAARQRRTSAGSMTDLKILQDSRYNFMPRLRTHHSLIRDRVNAVNSRLKTASGIRRAFIDPKCKQLIKCVTTQLYKENTLQPDKGSNLDHLPDAFGYHIDYLHPVSSELDGKSFSPMG